MISARYNLFKKLALLAACLALCVVVLGAYVRLTDAGLGCPDWPGCYGTMSVPQSEAAISLAQQVFPDKKVEVGKAWREMAHRYLAGTLGLLVLALTTLSWAIKKEIRNSVWLTTSLLLIIVLQAALGMWTVTMLLKPAIVTAHLIGGMTTLGILVWIAHRHWGYASENIIRTDGMKLAIRLALVILALQIFLGGWTSTNYAALACTDFPTCHGTFWPSMDFKGLGGLGTAERREHGLVLGGEGLGQHPVDDDRAERHRGLLAGPGDELDGLVDRHLLGCGDDVEGGERRAGEDVHHPLRLAPDRTRLHELADGAGGVELGEHVAGGRGVDDHEVPVGPALDRLADLPADLADGEDLLHSRRGIGHEVEHVGDRPDAPHHGDAQVELEVLAQRRLGVQLHREHTRVHLHRVEADRLVLEQVGEVALGVDLDEEDLLALLGRDHRGGRGDRALADAALAGDEEQAPVEEVDHAACRGVGPGLSLGRSRRASPRRRARSPRRRPARRGRRCRDPACR